MAEQDQKGAKPRPEALPGITSRFRVGCGNLYVTVNTQNDVPFEIFTHMGKAGACVSAQAEAVARLVSLAHRVGVDPKEIADQLRGISCPSGAWNKDVRINSCPDAIAHVLGEEKQDG